MISNMVRRALACASLGAIATVSTPAAAQQIDRIVAFGDSYADTGNAFALGYKNPQALSLYSTGRFSGGSNYIDTLANLLNVPVENFAIGGAFGGTNSGTLCFDATYGAPLCGKGLQYEIDQFFDVGTQSNVFPGASTSLDQSDLVAISIGGNDARIYQQAGGSLANAGAAGTAAAAGTAVQLNRLAVGNPTISFLALNGAVAPEVALNPAAQQIRGVFATNYYNALQSTLAGYAANGAIVHYLDGQLLLQNIAANPAAYGITNIGPCPAAEATRCVTDAAFRNQYLFYVDGLHLTPAGFEIVGKYVAAQVAAPLTLQAPSEAAMDTARQWGRTLGSRADVSGRTGPAGMRFFLVGDSFSRDLAPTDDNAEFGIDGVGGTIGAEFGLSSALVGVAANYSRPRVSFGNGSARDKARSWQVGAYGSTSVGGLFGQAYVGYGKDKHRLTRAGVVENMRARPSGSHVTAGAKAGYLLPMGVAQVGPIVALDYARAKVDGYTEAGDPALTLDVGSQKYSSLTGQLGVEARAALAGVSPFVALTAEHEFTGDNRLITFAQTSAPLIVNRWDVERKKETYGRLTGGLRASLGGFGSLDANVSSTLGRDGGQELSAQLGLKAGF